MRIGDLSKYLIVLFLFVIATFVSCGSPESVQTASTTDTTTDTTTTTTTSSSTISSSDLILNIMEGTTSNDSAEDIAVDSGSNIYVTGYTLGSLTGTNAGSEDAIIYKYDESGTEVWKVQFGTTSSDVASGVDVDLSGNVYIIGKTQGSLATSPTNAGDYDVFLTKYNSGGTSQWIVQAGSASLDVGTDIVLDSNGNIIIVGSTEGDFGGNTNSGYSDVFIAKYDTSGTNTWTKLLGGSGYDSAAAVAIDSSDNIYVTGYTNNDINGKTNSGGLDVFLVKYNSDGEVQWTVLFGTSGNEEGTAITADSSGYIYVAGYTNGDLSGTNNGGTDAFVAKYDSSGTDQWVLLIGTSATEKASGISVTSSGTFYVTGSTDGDWSDLTNNGAKDIFIFKYDSTPTLSLYGLIGTTGYDYSNAMVIDVSGKIHIAGRTNGDINGSTNAGSYDFFMMKY